MFLLDYYLVWVVFKGLLPYGGGSCGCICWIITWYGWFLRDYYLIASAAVGVFIGLLPGVAGS